MQGIAKQKREQQRCFQRPLLVAVYLYASSVHPAWAETPGKDGPITVSSSNVVLNEYGLVAGSLSAGQTNIPVSSLLADLPSLTSGDLIFIYQAQGATISGSNSAAYGAVTNLNGAGRYEFHTVASISGNTIALESYGGACGGLTYSYDPNRAQVIRVPQHTTLDVTSGSSIRADLWDGETGGVVVLHVEDGLTVNGIIHANARGFRGGAVDNVTGYNDVNYVSTNSGSGAEKGESIAGYQDDYPGGRYNRGAPANGGGGGNNHNAGGGGGANGNNGLTWNGQGNPNRSVTSWDLAWDIDGTLTSTTVGSGGGRGGYTYAREGDALTTPPDTGSWGGDRRREVGGLGGRPMSFEASGRVFFGGGGGAGDGNNNAAGEGGFGGGLVFIVAGSVTGGGNIQANGQSGRDTSPGHNDAPGGGGGGGTVVVKTGSLSGVQLRARGGRGGNQLITNTENEGPGGGGGGGVIAYSGGSPSSVNANGGTNGTTTASSMNEFIPNGATRGGSGQPNESAPSDAEIPFCAIPKGKLEATKSVAIWDPTSLGLYHLPGNDVVYSFDVSNVGYTPIAVHSIRLEDVLPPEVDFYNGELDPFDAIVTGPFSFENTSGTTGLTCCSASAHSDFANSPGTSPTFGFVPAAGYDGDVSHIQITPAGEMAPQTSFVVSFRARIK
jgi:hypothetical protein